MTERGSSPRRAAPGIPTSTQRHSWGMVKGNFVDHGAWTDRYSDTVSFHGAKGRGEERGSFVCACMYLLGATIQPTRINSHANLPRGKCVWDGYFNEQTQKAKKNHISATWQSRLEGTPTHSPMILEMAPSPSFVSLIYPHANNWHHPAWPYQSGIGVVTGTRI